MATFWGDILRLLAHSGFQTAGGIGKELVGSYLKPGMAVREAAGKNLLDVLATQTGAPAEAAAETLKSKFGVEWPRATGTGPGGSSELLGPGGFEREKVVRLTAPGTTPLAELAPGYEAQKRLVRGVPSLDKLKASVIQDMPQREKEIAVAPKDTQMTTELLKQQMAIEARLQDRALDRETKVQLANQHAEITTMLGLGMQEIHRGQLQATMDKNKWMSVFLSQRALDQDEKTAHTLIGNAVSKYEDIPIDMVEEKVAAANRFNALIDRYKDKYPEAVGGYTRINPKTPEWGPFGVFGGKPLPGVTPKKGREKVGKGPTPPEFPEKVTLPDGGMAVRTDQYSIKYPGKILYKMPDGTYQALTGGE